MKINKRKIVLAAFDTVCYLCAAAFSGMLFLLSFGADAFVRNDFLLGAALLYLFIFLVRLGVGIYSTIWRYTSSASYLYLMLSDICGTVLSILASFIIDLSVGAWFFVMTAALNVFAASFSRTSYRLIYKRKKLNESKDLRQKKICIVGAGQLGAYLVNDLRNNPESIYTPVCFVDNDAAKIGGRINGLPVYSSEKVKDVVAEHGIAAVVIAITGLDGEKLDELHRFYADCGCDVKLYASPLRSTDSKKEHVIRDFTIEDILFRRERALFGENESAFYRDKVVLITGGGGSIGSELCRNVAKCHPKKLVIFDICENGAYDIQQELIRQYGRDIPLSVEIGSVRDTERLDYIFRKHRPDIVFHAAAHKHVPLMEDSPAEAIKNNVFGTYNTANMAEKYNVQKFILISTDKAVNPANIMGASKRVCEMIVECRNDSTTSFSAVRFGNVLGSNGSVVPLFKRQIETGGPVTITDKRIIRYFMTIPEASQLVMTAGAMAKRGELFVLDMGRPVRIYDLAVNMIKLFGLVPEKDIEIKEIGLRPGEKLYEELLIQTETLDKTSHELIFVERDAPPTREEMEEQLVRLAKAIRRFDEGEDSDAIRNALKETVTTFREPNEVNNMADEEKMHLLSSQA